MKKLITLAIAAFVFGAFSVANAQSNTPVVKGDNPNKNVTVQPAQIDAKTTLKDAKEIDAKTTLKDAKEIDAKTTLREAEMEGKTTLKEAEIEGKTTLKEAELDAKKVGTKAAKVTTSGDTKTTITAGSKTDVGSPAETVVVDGNENWDKVLNSYETEVKNCLAIYEAVKGGKNDKATLTQFNGSLEKVEAIGAKIEKAMDQLSRSQLHRYNELKKKLAVVYQKG